MTDLREIGPTYYFAPPRVFENLLTQVMIRMEDAARIKRELFHYFHGRGAALRRRASSTASRACRSATARLYALGDLLIYGPLRNVLGMSRVRVAYTAGAAIGPDLFRFYRSIGINLKQLYGSTETCAYVCLQPDGQIKLDTVGLPAPGRRGQDRRQRRSAGEERGHAQGVLQAPRRHRRGRSMPHGYFHTGDAGFFDADGHLKIIDRAKDVGKLADGTVFAPNYIENKLKFFPYIKEAVAFGNGRDKVCAFINIDMRRGGQLGGAARPPVFRLHRSRRARPRSISSMQECVEKVNAELATDPMLAGSQVRRFLVLHKELDPDDDELTRTRKVRRGFIAQKYAALIEALYAGKAVQFVETAVKFEDGRSGVIAADVQIRNAKVYPAVEQRKSA